MTTETEREEALRLATQVGLQILFCDHMNKVAELIRLARADQRKKDAGDSLDAASQPAETNRRQEMNEREAFIAWWRSEYPVEMPFNLTAEDLGKLLARCWKAARAYQRKKDAEKCQQMALYTGVDCADAILKGDE